VVPLHLCTNRLEAVVYQKRWSYTNRGSKKMFFHRSLNLFPVLGKYIYIIK
jgi:hypothetical protein